MTFTLTIPPLPFSPIVLVLGAVVLVTLGLAYRAWISDKKNPANVYFVGFAAMLALWTLGLLGFYSPASPKLLSIFVQEFYITPTLAFPFFYLFTYYFPYRIHKFPTKVFAFIIFATVFFITIFLIPNLFISNEILAHNRFKPEANQFLHVIFGIYVVFIFFISFRNLIMKYKHSDGIFRIRLRQIIKGTGVLFVVGQIFSLTIPILYNDTLAWIGHLGLLYMSTYIWYHIFWKPSRIKKEHKFLKKLAKIFWSRIRGQKNIPSKNAAS